MEIKWTFQSWILVGFFDNGVCKTHLEKCITVCETVETCQVRWQSVINLHIDVEILDLYWNDVLKGIEYVMKNPHLCHRLIWFETKKLNFN